VFILVAGYRGHAERREDRARVYTQHVTALQTGGLFNVTLTGRLTRHNGINTCWVSSLSVVSFKFNLCSLPDMSAQHCCVTGDVKGLYISGLPRLDMACCPLVGMGRDRS